MSNVYKNAIYKPTTTVSTTVYTCNATARAIIQNIQFANTTGSHTISAHVFSHINSTTIQIGIDTKWRYGTLRIDGQQDGLR